MTKNGPKQKQETILEGEETESWKTESLMTY